MRRDHVLAEAIARNLAHALGETLVAIHQRMQIGAVQHQQPGARRRGDGGRAAGAAQHRDLPEEMADAEPHLLLRQVDLDLAGSDEIHRTRRAPLAHDDPARLDRLSRELAGDIGDLAGGQPGEQRHARHHAPGDDEIAPVDLVGERRRHDADRQGQHEDAHEHGQPADHAAERRDRHHVAVAGGGQRHDRPPHGVRHRTELVRLRLALDDMHDRSSHHGGTEQDDDAAEERPAFRIKRVEQRAHGRRIARQLEEADDAEDEQDAEIRGEEQGGPEGHHGQEIDQPGAAHHVTQPRRQVAPRTQRLVDRRPDAGRVFDREDDQRDDLDDVEDEVIFGRQRRHQFQNDRRQIEGDQNDQRRIDDPAERIVARRFLKDLEQTLAQPRHGNADRPGLGNTGAQAPHSRSAARRRAAPALSAPRHPFTRPRAPPRLHQAPCRPCRRPGRRPEPGPAGRLRPCRRGPRPPCAPDQSH